MYSDSRKYLVNIKWEWEVPNPIQMCTYTILGPLMLFLLVGTQNGAQKMNPKLSPKLDPNQDPKMQRGAPNL